MRKTKITTQALGGVKDAVKVYSNEDDLIVNVEVKELTKPQILKVIEEWGGWALLNATPFWYSDTNRKRLLQLRDEGKLKSRDWYGFVVVLCPDCPRG